MRDIKILFIHYQQAQSVQRDTIYQLTTNEKSWALSIEDVLPCLYHTSSTVKAIKNKAVVALCLDKSNKIIRKLDDLTIDSFIAACDLLK